MNTLQTQIMAEVLQWVYEKSNSNHNVEYHLSQISISACICTLLLLWVYIVVTFICKFGGNILLTTVIPGITVKWQSNTTKWTKIFKGKILLTGKSYGTILK